MLVGRASRLTSIVRLGWLAGATRLQRTAAAWHVRQGLNCCPAASHFGPLAFRQQPCHGTRVRLNVSLVKVIKALHSGPGSVHSIHGSAPL